MLQIEFDSDKLIKDLSSILYSDRPFEERMILAEKTIQRSYNRMISDFLESHPSYKYHCKYNRRLFICSETFRLCVKRVKDSAGSTHAVLFDFMVPYGL